MPQVLHNIIPNEVEVYLRVSYIRSSKVLMAFCPVFIFRPKNSPKLFKVFKLSSYLS